MPFELQSNPELTARRRRGLAVSVGIHVCLILFILVNPDLLDTTPTRIIRIAGEDFDRDRFEVQELFLPPDLIPPEPPPIAEAVPPVPEIELPPPVREAAPPPPAPPVPEPPPIIGPDDVIAEGARPDALPEVSPPEEAERPEQAGTDAPPSGNGSGSEPDDVDEVRDAQLGGPGRPEEVPLENDPIETAKNRDPNALVLPNFRQRAGDIIDQALADGRRQGVPGPPGPDDGALVPYDVDTEQPRILSDTRGYDFGPYMNQVINRVRFNWYSFIPEAARLGRQGRVVIVFTIVRDGGVANLRIVLQSGAEPLDRAASAAIQASNPFPPLPVDFNGDNLVLQFAFLYNLSRGGP